MAEKLWRLDVSAQIDAFVNSKNAGLKTDLDLKHSKSDIKFFSLKKVTYLEEDIFKYFYPFCLLNCSAASGVIFRQHSLPVILFVVAATFEYVYFIFAFPVEAWHFHKRAVSVNQPFAQHIRDSYIKRFPDSGKSKRYTEINESQSAFYKDKLNSITN